MDKEKRMVDTYEIRHSIHIGDKEILFGADDTKIDYTYIVCDCTWDNPLGSVQHFNAVSGADYLEMMTEFTDRVKGQIEAVKYERDKMSIPLEPFTLGHCIPNAYGESIENKVVAIRPERLRPEYRTAANQLVLVIGGFGAYANSRGRAVYTVNLYSGEESRWNREDIMGTLKPEHMPDWAKGRLEQIKAGRQEKHKKQEQER